MYRVKDGKSEIPKNKIKKAEILRLSAFQVELTRIELVTS